MISIQHTDENMLVILLMSFRGERQPSIHECVREEEGGREAGEETGTKWGILTSRLKGLIWSCML